MKLSPIRTLFATSYATYRASMWHLVALEVLPLFVMLIVGILSFATILAGHTAAAVALILIGVVLTIVVSVSSSIAMIQRLAKPRTTLDLHASLEATRPFFLSYLFVGILVAFFVFIGFILFIIPAIIVAVWLSFSYFVLVLEGSRGMDALKASKEYVRGLWFPIFGRIALVIIAVMLLTTVITTILETVFGKEGIADMLASIVNLIISPFVLAYFYHLYLDVKRAKHQHSNEPEPILA